MNFKKLKKKLSKMQINNKHVIMGAGLIILLALLFNYQRPVQADAGRGAAIGGILGATALGLGTRSPAGAVFGGLAGAGLGAAIGVFLADVIYGHHNALLSLLVGVPSNFGGFFIVGIFGKLVSKPDSKWISRFIIGSILGLGFGTLFIGFGLMGVGGIIDLNSLLGLPTPGDFTFSLAAYIAAVNFLGEIPFLLLAPSIIIPVYQAFPSLFTQTKNTKKSQEKT